MTMTPWVTAEVVLADPAFCNLTIDVDLTAAAEEACLDATSILFVLSGRTISGHRQVTVWPQTTEQWDPGVALPPHTPAYPASSPSDSITLEWPVVSVDEVVVDGDTLTVGDDYVVHDNRYLIRTPDTDGNRRYWPYSWTDTGTFRVTYTWGLDPPGWASDAARELAVSLLRKRQGLGSPLPAGVTSASQQGLSYSIGDRAQALRDGVTTETFPEVLRFLSLVNPSNERIATHAWSPDFGHQLRRVTYDGS